MFDMAKQNLDNAIVETDDYDTMVNEINNKKIRVSTDNIIFFIWPLLDFVILITLVLCVTALSKFKFKEEVKKPSAPKKVTVANKKLTLEEFI